MSITLQTKNGPKRYNTVAERLHEVHVSQAKFEMVESIPVQVAEHWVWRVVILVDGQQYLGHAEVHLNSNNFAEKADPWATSETSALGRALAFAGWLSDGSIASADEVLRG